MVLLIQEEQWLEKRTYIHVQYMIDWSSIAVVCWVKCDLMSLEGSDGLLCPKAVDMNECVGGTRCKGVAALPVHVKRWWLVMAEGLLHLTTGHVPYHSRLQQTGVNKSNKIYTKSNKIYAKSNKIYAKSYQIQQINQSNESYNLPTKNLPRTTSNTECTQTVT